MEAYPGLKCQNKNPLKLYKKIWYLSECKKFLEDQQLSNTRKLRDIAFDLWNYQKKRLGMSHKKCNDMVKEHFGVNESKSKDYKEFANVNFQNISTSLVHIRHSSQNKPET